MNTKRRPKKDLLIDRFHQIRRAPDFTAPSQIYKQTIKIKTNISNQNEYLKSKQILEIKTNVYCAKKEKKK